MRQISFKFRTSSLFTILVVLAGTLMSCENKVSFIPKSDLITLPSQSVKDFKTFYNDSGRVQLIVSAPEMEQYDDKDFPHTDFKSGIKVLFYDGKIDSQGYVTAKYARFTKNNNLWELKDSVIVVNQDNDRLETEVLFWDQSKDLIYTDRFVKITSVDQIVQGFGFDSDAKLTKRRIKKVTATIYLKDEE
jgi:LPS export ABC transporter protein LptC